MAEADSRRWPAPWRRPPLPLLAAVMAAHALLLGLRPPPATPSVRPAAPVVQVRVVDAPAPGAHQHADRPAEPRLATPQAPQRVVMASPVSRPAARAAPDRAVARNAAARTATARPATMAAVAVAEPPADRTPEAAPTPSAAPAAHDSPPAPVRLPTSARLRYQVHGTARGQPFDTEAQLTWQRDGDRYEAEWTVQLPAQGQRTQRSEGAVTVAGLAPARYAEQARGERAAHFDPAGGRIRFSANTPDAALRPGAQDRLSAPLQLGGLIAAAPHRYLPGDVIVLPTAGVRDAEPWQWEVLPDEVLQIDDRPLPCTKLVRHPRRDYDARVELWLARDHAYLPARLRTTAFNGDVVDQQLAALPPR
ncbi:DUF3108 domain-containing protein [Ottowia sp. SB7-C50]|uniref:DUF3108 domain-containing protein n=1 Tax=Ottowia sp. SB7-C50 TaxID=3081231 RepID=UPI002955C3EE|nr:DUF3108 domain-containing protein [Ottowia sp. SB7-C50]WOP15239.1 DUF3108 domain-containing protein [Ottowia sp. SB7-C50]